MELVSKIISLLEKLMPTVIGWFLAKQDSRVNNLKNENERLKDEAKIDNLNIDANSALNGL